ncbi:MAG: macro domain-containing protein [Planctomycetota bacterium]|jgi:O-acetyl-ADP-ribose deacetylase (regulator of RNase III)
MVETVPESKQINQGVVRLVKGDITDLDVEAFVFYAQPDLALGSGFGTAISVRGGPTIQKELEELGPVATGEAVITAAGNLKANFIVHAVGPRFQEEDTENKLRTTMVNVLKQADAKGIKRIAFPAMGYGFYGIPLNVSAKITMQAAIEHLQGQTGIEEIIVCLMDNQEYKLFQEEFAALQVSVTKATV